MTKVTSILRLSVKSLGLPTEIVDLDEAISPAVFTANNYDIVVTGLMSEKYGKVSVPVKITGDDYYIAVLEFKTDDVTVSRVRELAARLTVEDADNAPWESTMRTTDLIREIARKDMSLLNGLDPSPVLTEKGKKDRLSVMKREDIFSRADEYYAYSESNMYEGGEPFEDELPFD